MWIQSFIHKSYYIKYTILYINYTIFISLDEIIEAKILDTTSTCKIRIHKIRA